MKTRTRLALLLAAGMLAIAGCGGGDSGSEADTAAINELVAGINRANAEKDGAAYCELLQPSTFLETFDSMNECARETDQILNQAGDQPELEVEDITIDGDTAMVSFVGRSGEAPFVREGESWYLALGQGTAAPAEEPATGQGGSGNGG
jgi:hypothetical protein